MMRDRDAMAAMIERARKARCSALVLTLDLQVIGQRHKDLKNELTRVGHSNRGQHHQPDDQTALGAWAWWARAATPSATWSAT